VKKWLRKYRFFVLFIPGVAAVAGIYAYREYNRKLPDTHRLKSAFHLKSTELIRKFESDESKATAQYSDKVISVEGLIGSIHSTDSSGTVFLNDGSSMTSVMCQFDRKNFHEMLTLQKGKLITIKGICSGYLMDVVMVRCVMEQ
jgi:hypothetical protein